MPAPHVWGGLLGPPGPALCAALQTLKLGAIGCWTWRMLWRDASVAWPGQMPFLVGTQDAWGPPLPGREDSGMVAFGFVCSSLPCLRYDIPPFNPAHVCECGERLIA